jgi:Ricin-type beta-trefoil lectin domain-like
MSTHILRNAGRLAAVAALGIGALAAAGTAQASTSSYSIEWLTSQYWISPTYDAMNVAVSQGATYLGAPVIQWYNDGGSEQKWIFGDEFNGDQFVGYVIENANSSQCLTTDGNAGDQLYQFYCEAGALTQVFTVTQNDGGADLFQNVGTGLYLDVSGYSWGAGASMDLWYANGQPNQEFWLTDLG